METVIGQCEAMRVLRAVSPAHVLLIGTPGMGKTHIARWYAESIGGNWVIMEGMLLNRKRLANMYVGDGSVSTPLLDITGAIIVDEVHVAADAGLEQFYPHLDTRPIPRTFIFTTTDEGKLPPALISRLVVISLKQYDLHELAEIAATQVSTFPQAVRMEIAKLCHGSPRRAKIIAGLLDEVGKKNGREVEAAEVRGVMKYLGYPEGLYDRELEIMRALSGGSKSLNTLCALLATSKETIGFWETGLIAAGLVTISPRGRILTDEGRKILVRVEGKSGGELDRTVI